jgi:F-box protein 11
MTDPEQADGEGQGDPGPVAGRSPGPAARTPRSQADPRRVAGPPRELVVDPTDPAGFAEIDLAVAMAEDGDRVVVRPGTYRVPVVVDRAIELVGDGPREAIVLEPAGAEVLSLCASGAVVRHLTIRPAVVGNDGTDYSAIWVRDVVATIEDCDLTSHLGAAVWVGGRSSRATIRGCRIHDGATNGVAAWDEGTAIVEDCDITGHRWPGVMARGAQSNATVLGCRIVDNLSTGAAADCGATLLVEHSLVARNAESGVVLAEATPRSRIEDNDIDGNAGPAVLVRGGVGGRIHGNRFRRNELGVVVTDAATPDVSGNEAHDCSGPAILVIGTRTDPAVSDNLIVTPRATAIVVRDGGAGRFERNRITADRQPGVWIQEEGSSPVFIENIVTGSVLIGIAVTGHAGGAFERNDLRGNKAAWDLDEAGPVELSDNLEDPRPAPGWSGPGGYVN